MVVAAAFVVVESLLLLPISVVVLDVVVAVVVVAVLLVFDISFERSLLSGKSERGFELLALLQFLSTYIE